MRGTAFDAAAATGGAAAVESIAAVAANAKSSFVGREQEHRQPDGPLAVSASRPEVAARGQAVRRSARRLVSISAVAPQMRNNFV